MSEEDPPEDEGGEGGEGGENPTPRETSPSRIFVYANDARTYLERDNDPSDPRTGIDWSQY